MVSQDCSWEIASKVLFLCKGLAIFCLTLLLFVTRPCDQTNVACQSLMNGGLLVAILACIQIACGCVSFCVSCRRNPYKAFMCFLCYTVFFGFNVTYLMTQIVENVEDNMYAYFALFGLYMTLIFGQLVCHIKIIYNKRK